MSSLIRKTLLFISVKMILGLLVLMAGSLGYAEPSIFYVHNDHLGTPQKVTNASEAVVWEADYLPFGEATVNADPDGDQTDFELNIRFPGQYHDIETGTYYNYYRDYDPSLGRYIQRKQWTGTAQTTHFGRYGGLIDQLRVFDRVLTATEAFTLSKEMEVQ